MGNIRAKLTDVDVFNNQRLYVYIHICLCVGLCMCAERHKMFTSCAKIPPSVIYSFIDIYVKREEGEEGRKEEETRGISNRLNMCVSVCLCEPNPPYIKLTFIPLSWSPPYPPLLLLPPLFSTEKKITK